MRTAIGLVFLALFVANIVVIVWIWVANHNLDFRFAPDLTSAWMARLGGLTGLLGAYLALVQVLLLARLPFLGRVAGFDRLTVWHRWNGYACLTLVLAHTVLAVYGYAIDRHVGFFDQFWKLVADNFLQGMVTATIGLALFVLVSVTSIVIVKRRLNYELWYAVHFTAYAAIAFAWFHQIPTGGDLALSPGAARYWRALFLVTLILLLFRVASPLWSLVRYNLRVAEVKAESPTVTTIRITGRGLDKLHARPGQFFLWRFVTRGFWYTAHPFSLSAAPDGKSLRISVKASGDHTSRMGTIPVGTRVVAEGPFGTFTESFRRGPKELLVAGGIGITPVRALAERMDGDLVVIHRVLSDCRHRVSRRDDRARRPARLRAALPRRRSRGRRAAGAALERPSEGARPRYRRARRLRLRPAGDGLVAARERARRRGFASPHPCGAVRAVGSTPQSYAVKHAFLWTMTEKMIKVLPE